MSQVSRLIKSNSVKDVFRQSHRRFSPTNPAAFHSSRTHPNQSTTSPSPSPSRPQKSRARASRLARRAGSDSVGLPDPISNLRPVRYGSAFETESENSPSPSPSPSPSTSRSASSPPSSSSSSSSTHPYSLSEFNSPNPSSKLGSSANFYGAPKPYSAYFLRLVEKLQEAELIHKLRRSRADSFNQRFWSDNNSRFQSDLSNFTRHQSQAIISPPSIGSTSTSTTPTSTNSSSDQISQTSRSKAEAEVDLAPFYSAWLSANSKRHQRYNRTLVRQIFRDLAPAARYQMLRNWTGLVRKWEEFRRRGPG